MPVCHVCQHDNPTGAEFCEECGASLAPVGAPAGAASGQASASTPPASEVKDASPPMTPNPTPVEATLVDPPPTDATPAIDSTNATPVREVGPAESDAAAAPPAVPSSVGQNPRLVTVRHGAPTGEEIPLLGERMVVGRFDPETGPVDIDLSSAPESVHISRQHGELRRDADGTWTVRDLGSTNGVFVKGSGAETFGPRITAPKTLADGDEVAFGNARFTFRTS